MKRATFLIGITVLWIILTVNTYSQDGTIFPRNLDWTRVEIINDNGDIIKVASETEFLVLTSKKEVTYKSGTTTKVFNCCVDALFWIFKSELSTNSHFGDRELKELYKSKL